MNNFDLRKYLAEGRLKVNEGDMDHLMQDLERELKQHDWFYYMSDDNRSYVKGEDQQRELKRLLKMLNNSPEAIALYNKYAPVQDGIDLRIKEEKIEEAIKLPKDIEWEFDDVIDQMDAYNATISLTGHSESTGKDYTASAEASRGGSGGDWDWMEVDEVEEETVAEEKRPDYPDVDEDGDTEESMEKALKDKKANLKEWGSSDWHYFLDAMHTDLGKPTDAPDIFKVLDVAGDAVDKYWDDWEEYETDREGLNMHAAQTYLKTKFPEYFKGMQALFAPMNEESIKESPRAYNVIDAKGNIIHEELPYDKALEIAKKLNQTEEGDPYKIDATDRLAFREGDYDPDQEQLDDEDEIFMPMDDEGRPLEEALNPEVVKAVNRLIKGLAKRYDYSEQDAVFAIMAALKQRDFDGLNEATRQDLGMSSSVSKRRAKAELKNPGNDGSKVYGLDKDGKRIHIKNINDVDKFKKFELDADLNEGYYGSSDIDNIASTLGYDDIDSFFNDNPGAVDAIMQWAETVPDFGRMLQDAGMMQEDLDLGHEDDEPGMLKGDLYKIGNYAMELYQMMDDLEGIDGEVDLPHWWQSKVTTAKNMISGAKHYLEFELKEPAIDSMVFEAAPEEEDEFHRELDKLVHKTFGHSSDEKKEMKEYMSLEDQARVYFMQKVKRGEIDELPEDPKAAFLAQMTKDQMDHDRETLDREGGLGEASFYTDDVKSKVVSKLMDQLKK
jgi:hypothetical protein